MGRAWLESPRRIAIITVRGLHQATKRSRLSSITKGGDLMKRRTIAASFVFAWLLTAGGARAAQSTQSSASPSSSTSSPPKATSHKHKHYAKRQPPGQKAPAPDRISEIQSALAREGYYQGDPTGKFDSATLTALEKFQSANGLGSSGKLDAPTLQKLGLGSDVAGVSAPKPVVPSCCAAKPVAPGSTAGASCCSATSNPQTQSPNAVSPNATPSVAPSDTKPEPK
jgi:peptidoglycan hydrolase-like protein with peptidoglycan-binding domain